MKTVSATLFGAKHLEMVETEMPPLADGMVRIKFRAGGICGSDLHYYNHGKTADFIVSEPLVLGHEVAGEIHELGSSVSGLAVGDRVAINPSRWCGQCAPCRSGALNLCERIFFMGSASKKPHMQGGFSTYFDAIPEQCHPLGPATPFEAGALAEPLAVCLHAVSQAGNVSGQRIAIQGSGPIGLLIMLAARSKGADDITLIDIADMPLELGRKLGARSVSNVRTDPHAIVDFSRNNPFDIVFEVTGTPVGFTNAQSIARRGGTIVQIGNLPGGQQTVQISAIMGKELKLRGSFRFGREFAEACDLINAQQVDVLSIVTGRDSLSNAPQAFEAAQERQKHLKLVLTSG
jgi:L-idonate 5-dehydrogenase